MKQPHIVIIYDYACTVEGADNKLNPAQDISQMVGIVNSILKEMNYPVFSLGIKKDVVGFLNTITRKKTDLVFNLCESVCGESSKEMYIPAILDLMRLPYTGSDALALGLSLDKSLTKRILIANNINTPKFIIFSEEIKELKKKDMENLRFPLIIKPLSEDGSIGINKESVVNNEEQLICQVNLLIKTLKEPAIAEEYIQGREIYVPIIGNKCKEEVLPLSEIDFSKLPKDYPHILSYNAKWEKKSAEYKKTIPICPINLEKHLLEEIKDMAIKVFRIMSCRDYARIDIRLSKDNVPYVIDVNPNPCLEEDAGLANSARISGIEYPELIDRIVKFAWNRANGNIN